MVCLLTVVCQLKCQYGTKKCVALSSSEHSHDHSQLHVAQHCRHDQHMLTCEYHPQLAHLFWLPYGHAGCASASLQQAYLRTHFLCSAGPVPPTQCACRASSLVHLLLDLHESSTIETSKHKLSMQVLFAPICDVYLPYDQCSYSDKSSWLGDRTS